MQHEQRLHLLTSLRVLATAAVVFGHACGLFSGFSFTQWPALPYIQNTAVTVFFCISGYTIAWVCDTRSRRSIYSFTQFVFDRAIRLAVPLFPFLVVCALVEAFWLGPDHPHPEALSLTSFVGNLLFLQWLSPWLLPLSVQPFGLNRPLWTLALEFWTYVLFAGLFFGGLRGKLRPWPIIASVAAAWLLGNTLYGAQGAGLPLIWFLSAGVYFLLNAAPAIGGWARLASLSIFVCATLAMLWPRLWPSDGGYSLTYNLLIFTSFASLMIVMSRNRAPRERKLVTFLAGFAYSTYILHYPIMYGLHLSGWLPEGEISVIFATSMCFAAGWVWGYLFERHYRAIRDWLWLRVRSAPRGRNIKTG